MNNPESIPGMGRDPTGSRTPRSGANPPKQERLQGNRWVFDLPFHAGQDLADPPGRLRATPNEAGARPPDGKTPVPSRGFKAYGGRHRHQGVPEPGTV